MLERAKAQNESHQLTAKRTLLLESLSMVSCNADANDKRRRIFALTRKGKRESKLVEARCEDALQVFEELNRELDLHLGDALDSAYDALLQSSMLTRSSD